MTAARLAIGTSICMVLFLAILRLLDDGSFDPHDGFLYPGWW